MAVFLPLYCGHRISPCIRRPLMHLGPITRTYHGPEGDPAHYDPNHCPLGVCSKKSPKKKKKSPKSSPKGSPKVSPTISPRISPKTSPGHTLPVPKVPCETEKVREKPPQITKESPVYPKEIHAINPAHGDFSSILVTTPPKEDSASPTGEADESLWSHELHLHNIKLNNLKVSLVENNRVYIEEHQDLSMGNRDELYESYTRRQMVLVPDHVDVSSLSAYLYHNGVLLLTAKRSEGSVPTSVK